MMFKNIRKYMKSGIRNIIRKLVRWAVRTDDCVVKDSSSYNSPQISKNGLDDLARGLNFTVYSASGGKIIQCRTYDHQTDRHTNNLYIITDKESLGEELDLIITRESLSR